MSLAPNAAHTLTTAKNAIAERATKKKKRKNKREAASMSIKNYSLKEAAALLHHRGGGYGLKLDIENADDFPIRVFKKNGRWQGLNDITLPVLAAYYENKGATTNG